MDKTEQLAKIIIATLKRCDEVFDVYWNKLDPLDEKEILEELQDSIYDWLGDNE